MYWNIIDEKRKQILSKIDETISLPNYYMIGGTALSLQLGLRESFDFDFCVPNKFNNYVLISELRKIGNDFKIITNEEDTCDVIIDDVQVSFFYFPNKIIENLVIDSNLKNIKLANVFDIAIMKINAIGGRGEKKGFFDLYLILQKYNFTSKKLAEGLIMKYGNEVNYQNILMGLSYFEDAEEQNLPRTFVEYDWDKIKNFFEIFQKEMVNEFNKIF